MVVMGPRSWSTANVGFARCLRSGGRGFIEVIAVSGEDISSARKFDSLCMSPAALISRANTAMTGRTLLRKICVFSRN